MKLWTDLAKSQWHDNEIYRNKPSCFDCIFAYRCVLAHCKVVFYFSARQVAFGTICCSYYIVSVSNLYAILLLIISFRHTVSTMVGKAELAKKTLSRPITSGSNPFY